MSCKPRIPIAEFVRFCTNPQYLPNLQPAENHMAVRCPRNITPTPAGIFFYFLEPAEEQKQVSDLDALRIQVRLRSPRLAKSRPPTLLTGQCFIAQIRIEMRWRIR